MKLKITAIVATAFLSMTSSLFAAAPVMLAYFVNWGVYGRNFHPENIQINDLTTVIYAFTEVGNCATPYATDSSTTLCNASGQYGTATGIQDYKLYSADAYSDFNIIPQNYKHAGESGLGNISKVLKIAHSHNKQALLSIGGWTLSVPMRTAMDDSHRAAFIQSIIAFLNLAKADSQGESFDGVDIDFEPNNWNIITAQNITDYVNFLHDLNIALKTQYRSDAYVTIATWADPAIINKIGAANWKSIASSVKYIDVMTYDYHAGWDDPKITNFLAPLHFDSNQPQNTANRTTFNIDATIQAYLNQGVNQNQLVLGIPAYGRAVSGVPNQAPAGYPTAFGLYQTFTGIPNGQWEGDPGLFDYKYILSHMLGNGFVDSQVAGTAFAYNPTLNGGEFISYDNVNTIREKVQYVQANQLAGMMMWELSEDLNYSDANYNTSSLLHAAYTALNENSYG